MAEWVYYLPFSDCPCDVAKHARSQLLLSFADVGRSNNVVATVVGAHWCAQGVLMIPGPGYNP